MILVSAFVAAAMRADGAPYSFGAIVDPSDPHPAAFDCSELVRWAAYQAGMRPAPVDGSWNQVRVVRDAGRLIPVEEATRTPGALLFRFSSDPFSGGAPTERHVAISLGDGRTIEARSKVLGTGVFGSADRGWTHAGHLPSVDYGPKRPDGASLAVLALILTVAVSVGYSADG